MNEYKGKQVRITIFNRGLQRKVVQELIVFLDTDTMGNVFTDYDVDNHDFVINPFNSEEKISE
jgi:hypothetical protein